MTKYVQTIFNLFSSSVGHRRVFEQYIKMELNNNAASGKKITFSIPNPGAVPTSALEAIKEYIARKEYYINNNLSELAKYNLYNKNEAIKLVRERAPVLTEKLKKLNPKRNSFNENILKEFNSSIEAAIRNFNNPQEILEFANSGLSSIEGLISQKDEKYIASYSQPRCTSATCKKAYENYLSMLKPESIIITYKDALSTSTAFDRSINKCKAMVVARISPRLATRIFLNSVIRPSPVARRAE